MSAILSVQALHAGYGAGDILKGSISRSKSERS